MEPNITTTHPLPDGRNFTKVRNPRAHSLVDEIKLEACRLEVMEAIKSRITPEQMAAVFATLPAKAERIIAVKFLIEPPVVRRVKIKKSPRK